MGGRGARRAQERQCTRKTVFITYRQAAKAAGRVEKTEREHETTRRIVVYRCPFCKQYHIGTRKAKR